MRGDRTGDGSSRRTVTTVGLIGVLVAACVSQPAPSITPVPIPADPVAALFRVLEDPALTYRHTQSTTISSGGYATITTATGAVAGSLAESTSEIDSSGVLLTVSGVFDGDTWYQRIADGPWFETPIGATDLDAIAKLMRRAGLQHDATVTGARGTAIRLRAASLPDLPPEISGAVEGSPYFGLHARLIGLRVETSPDGKPTRLEYDAGFADDAESEPYIFQHTVMTFFDVGAAITIRPPEVTPILTVVSILPTSGDFEEGFEVDQGVALALDGRSVNGWQIQHRQADDAPFGVESMDDAWQHLARSVTDLSVVAVIGPSDPAVATELLYLTCYQRLLQIYPTTTYPLAFDPETGLPDDALPVPDCPPNHIRMAPRDDYQALAAARWAEQQGWQRVWILESGTSSFQSSTFADEAERLGIRIAGRTTVVTRGPSRDRALVASLREARADAIFVEGRQDSPIMHALLGIRTALPDLGTVAISPDAWTDLVDDLGIAMAGMDVIGRGAPVHARGLRDDQFSDRYRTTYGIAPGYWAAYGYDAGELVLATIERATASGADLPLTELRARIVDQAYEVDHLRTSEGVRSVGPDGVLRPVEIWIQRVGSDGALDIVGSAVVG